MLGANEDTFYNPLESPVTNVSKMITATAPHSTPLPKPILKNASFNHDPDRVPLTVDELVRSRASLGSEQPVICYPRTGIEYVDYPLRQLDIFSFRVAGAIAAKVPSRASSRDTPTVVSLLGTSDLSYLVMLLAVAKLGHTGLLLSTRISIEAYVSLLERTNSRHVFIHESFKATAEELKQRLPDLQVEVIPTQEFFNYPIPEGNVDTNMVPWLDPVAESKHLAWIIHSSGSTGLPKPIYQTQAAAVRNYSGHMNMSGFITLPLYHNHGISVLFRTIYSSKRLYLYNAELPLTRQHLLDIMQAHPLEIFYGVPYALKLLAETEEGIAALAQFKAVMFGGSACPDSLGNLLVENNVNLISHYGSTETGQLMTSFRPREDKEWDYLRPSEAVKKYLRFEERYPGIFELICLDGWPSKVISNRPDGSYATKDLFVKHPTLEAYKYYARLDDTIVLVNGEKVNPLDMEGRVRQLNTISEAIVFGAGKASIGLAVVRAPGTASMPDQELIESIWPAVEAAHEAMPAYGQLSKSMVRVLPEDTPYPRTDKGTIIRQRFYKEFSNLIEEAYEAEDAMSGSLVLSETELKAFLKDQLRDILAHRKEDELTEDADFFALGMDSLQATQLRSILMKTLNTNGQKLGLNVAFEHPTIGSLARHLDSLHSGATTDVQSVEDQMAELISKYSDFQKHVPMSNGLDGRYIVITGATGSLGAHVVRKLSVRPEVQKIYCLVRAGSPIEGYSRVLQSMRSRRVFDGLTDVAKQKIVALPSDLSQATLGLGATTYSTLTSEITDVIHCAWSVNFNMHLSSFEKDSIGGLKNLLDLCLKAQRPAPASFNFCSSISSVVGTVEDDISEALPKKLSYAQNMGYAQSKLVSEHICMNAAQQAGICARVLRIGQVIGDQDHGVWNSTEAIPLMLQAATTIGALPKLNESPLWLPVDTVAGTVTDISLSSTAISKPDAELVFNIVSHHPFHWTKDLLPYVREAGLEFEELEQRDWIHRLRTSNPDPVANPPIKLVDFFASKYDTDKPRRSFNWHTERAREVSNTLADARPLDRELVGKMIEYFRKECWSLKN
ncbi:non-ribosomal peptide synthetase [Aspergillus oryzae 100-8]|uniref:Non-ribosomal peptide synthetase/alpha-aminoadipate reductase n=1 Tax=Aspergillus oryzae (strain 3.042) TaxID=1160506 RepID=I8THA2_ASPO3|nr:non-ribosomal peptide synthetase/alpha-aminoadipate reductase [Aspergillus oryzae 3.042]KDE82174.1 non-ribosomal peptide synthetase [Aspergillus oryzae 100-8]|eukprot:EIT73093.1 non-ribosomal peptide synthetase/alpha-aminoadipate reductase [Aspergillus oryzae 3.042]